MHEGGRLLPDRSWVDDIRNSNLEDPSAMMRKMLLAAAVGLIAVSVAGNGLALERTKTLTQIGDNGDRGPGPWGANDGCTLSYYNFCAGWIYVWSGWTASDVIGIEFDPEACGPKPNECATVLGAWVYFLDAYPTYGFTASVGTGKWGNQPGHLGKITSLGDPQEWYDGWNFVDLHNAHVGGGGILFIHFDNPGPLAYTTEALPLMCNPDPPRPACQTCPQPASSYYYGSLSTGNFSGSQFYAGVYFPSANDLITDIIVTCIGPTAVEPSSWGNIKAMYE
jgi:hypothetical protein